MNYLFIYGTLLLAENTFGLYLKNQSKHLSTGWFKGRLFDLGDYPGAVYEPNSNTLVAGTIVELNQPEEALKVMDDYEGFGLEHPQPNEFIRQKIEIESDKGFLTCWTYLYNLPVENLREIKQGNYLSFLNERA